MEADNYYQSSNLFKIKIAETADEKEQVFNLRYQVYIEEQGRPSHYADHKYKRLEDPLDDSANIFVAYQNEQLVGTLRNNLATNSNLEYYPQLYQMDTVGNAYPQYTSMSSKLIIKKELRGSPLFLDLKLTLYQYLLIQGIKFDFGECDIALTYFYRKLGYQQIGRLYHPEYGEGEILRLSVQNLNHLERINSPFQHIHKSLFHLTNNEA